MEQFWGALIASAITALAALGGVWISNRHLRQGQKEILLEQARADHRALLHDLLSDAREWANYQKAFLPMLQTFEQKDFIDWAQTDTAKRLGDLFQQMERSLTQARLFIGQPDMREAIQDLSYLKAVFPERINGGVLRAISESDRTHALQSAAQWIDEFETKLDALEQTGAHFCAVLAPSLSKKERLARDALNGLSG